MIQEIKYAGITNSPSEYDCPDGDVASMMNLVNENGNLVPVTPPETLFTLEDGQKVLYIHKTSDYCNYIVYDVSEGENNGKICFFTDEAPALKDITSISNKELYQISSIGNTLVILTNEGLVYALYKSGAYVIMGDRPEFPSISFRLQGERKSSNMVTSNFPAGGVYGGGLFGIMLSNEAAQATRNVVFSYINSDSANTKNLNGFQYPFMIRYAYRLYDESLYMLSVPIKMSPSEGYPYLVRVAGYSTYNGQINAINMYIFSVQSVLFYEIINYEKIKESLSNWADLVKSIDVFITPSLNGIDSERGCTRILPYRFFGPSTSENAVVISHMNMGEKDENGKSIYRKHDMSELWTNISSESFVGLAPKTFLANDSALPFYLISSIEIKNISKGELRLPIDNGVLNGLTGREVMKGDSQQSGTLVAKYAFTYNSRLNLANVTVIPPSMPLESCFQYINGEYDENTRKGVKKTYKYKAYVFIESEKQDIMIDMISNLDMNLIGDFFFYPNPKAFRLIIERIDSNGVKTYSNSKLTEHKFLNGAFTNSLGSFKSDFDTSILKNASRGIPYYNKIYTSEVNNPFSFPPTGVNAVGSGEILGIRSATKALSQGQFGQFPLYAFTDEGVWGLEVSNEGTFSAKQPITRDVCNNPESITQIDTAVLFSSDRGIMLIQGADSTCISEKINDKLLDVSKLKGFSQLAELSGFTTGQFNYVPFQDYIKGCSMSYDYKNQRIIIFNKNLSYAYVWALKSKTWSMLPSNFVSAVNSYPDSYLMTNDNELVNLSNNDKADIVGLKGIIITRSLKLGAPDMFKTIDASIHRGTFNKGHVKTAIYGSRDLINWFFISSSKDHYLRGFRGTPYKYFRFVILTEFDSGESLSGTTVSFDYRQNNKIR